MGVISSVADAAVAILPLTVALTSPLLVAQTVLPPGLYPEPLRALRRWYAAEFDDYLLADPPSFFRGIAWLELDFLLPVAAATLYGVLARRRWAATGSLVLGVCVVTSTSAIPADIVGSGRATPKLLLSYVPIAILAGIAILRGLCSCSGRATAGSSAPGPAARKKRV
ncbi:hypothetical protein BAE44_0012438 [Dichanthelium oligosanthes]|uniref:EXPERA domain-containing protein n=1 Tax=Dichanthelium oligosanthes TaxID=888268 RepID=A0A1E5VN34_9POAL|nr:hypothetical protein BAE44_0012438 [Dichanthelium oligosanthes]